VPRGLAAGAYSAAFAGQVQVVISGVLLAVLVQLLRVLPAASSW